MALSLQNATIIFDIDKAGQVWILSCHTESVPGPRAIHDSSQTRLRYCFKCLACKGQSVRPFPHICRVSYKNLTISPIFLRIRFNLIRLQSYVALNIATAFWNEKPADHEASIFRRIQDANPDHPGRRYCPRLIDQFNVESEHGDHSVIVTPVLGPSVYTVLHQTHADKIAIPLPVVKQWAREMLMALDYIHTDVGVIHSGNQPYIHPSVKSCTNNSANRQISDSPISFSMRTSQRYSHLSWPQILSSSTRRMTRTAQYPLSSPNLSRFPGVF
jgi:serine/threonine protein kinase